MKNTNTIITTAELTTRELVDEVLASKPEHLAGLEPSDVARLVDISKDDQPEVVKLILEGKFPEGFLAEGWALKFDAPIPTPTSFVNALVIIMGAFKDALNEGVLCDAIRVARGLPIKGCWNEYWNDYDHVEAMLIDVLAVQPDEDLEELVLQILTKLEEAADEADLWRYREDEEGGEGNA